MCLYIFCRREDGFDIHSAHPCKPFRQRIYDAGKRRNRFAEGKLHKDVGHVKTCSAEEKVRREEAADVDLRGIRYPVDIVGHINAEDTVRAFIDRVNGSYCQIIEEGIRHRDCGTSDSGDARGRLLANSQYSRLRPWATTSSPLYQIDCHVMGSDCRQTAAE